MFRVKKIQHAIKPSTNFVDISYYLNIQMNFMDISYYLNVQMTGAVPST